MFLFSLYCIYLNTATITIKTNQQTKIQARKTAEELGFSLSSLLNAFLRHLAKTRKVAFSSKDIDEIPNARTQTLLEQSEKDVKAGRVTRFNSWREVFTYLDREIENDKHKIKHGH